jgi:bifunctional non-homologous end joining protein LigD
MLPTAGPLPTASGWSFEFKWDGIRICTQILGGEAVRLQTRLGNDVLPKFPELVDGVDLGDIVLDGELVILTDDIPDWGAVIRRRQARPGSVAALAQDYPATVMVFDVLRHSGEDLRSRPYWERRALLEGLDLGDGWAVPPASDDGQAVVAVSLAYGLEGIVAKKNTSRYQAGKRSREWIKVRHKGVVDAVVLGWRRRESGGVTLLLAEARGRRLVYIGRCTAPRSIVATLEPLAVDRPMVDVGEVPRGVHWVRPVLEVEVTAAARTPDGRLRQPKFMRVRLDRLG